MTTSSANTLTLIIGGSSGMGLETARQLVSDGASVILVGRDSGKLAARQQELEAIGAAGTVESIAADLYESNALAALIARIDEEPRYITGLVNAAGYRRHS